MESSRGQRNFRKKMPKHNRQPISSKGQWQTVVEFSLPDEVDRAHKAGEMVAEFLVSIRAPDHFLVEVRQAAIREIEKELSRAMIDQAQRNFTILIQTQSAQLLETLATETSGMEQHTPPKGWGFFLTKTMAKTGPGGTIDHVVISIYLYYEGDQL